MNSNNITYLVLTLFSILLSVTLGKERYIGITWSIIYSIFCPIASIGIIFLSKKKLENSNPPSLFNQGLTGFVLLFFLHYEKYPAGIFESIGALTLPIIIFSHNFSGEIMGAASATNLFTIFPFYALLRNFTLKYLP
jgi:hypothetical protein